MSIRYWDKVISLACTLAGLCRVHTNQSINPLLDAFLMEMISPMFSTSYTDFAHEMKNALYLFARISIFVIGIF